MPYRKLDQYYIDLYDRKTIAEMKVKEKVEVEELSAIPESDAEKRQEVSMDHSMGHDSFTNYGVGRARDAYCSPIARRVFMVNKPKRLVKACRTKLSNFLSVIIGARL